jgi:sugar lactone lactonase YvrE
MTNITTTPRSRPATLLATLLAGALMLGAAAGCGPGAEDAGTDGETAAADLPDTLRIQDPGLHPEGIEWDGERGRFLVSSVTRGTVTSVDDDGSHEAFVRDTEITSSIGVHIDAENERILVAGADLSATQDTTVEGEAKLGAYDLETGQQVYMADLAPLAEGRHFANDMTSGPDGTAYVTDSFSPVIYSVSPEGEPSVLVRDDRLGGTGFGLNGIDYHPDGYLVVAMAGDRTFYKIPLDDPEAMTEVDVPEPISADGIVFRSPTELAVVGTTYGDEEESRSEVLLLASDDGWESATVAGRRATPLEPTTAAIRDGQVYAVTPHFSGMGGDEPVEVFEIFRVEFGN